jgi:CMP-N-acetylneuraminic acid synthetase
VTTTEPSTATAPTGEGRRVLAVIPARGGSKGVPGKNLAPVAGVPLVARAVRACLAARLVTDVAVSTDDPAIAAAARAAGAEAVLRPAATSVTRRPPSPPSCTPWTPARR